MTEPRARRSASSQSSTQFFNPHPEERCVATRLEGWQHTPAPAVILRDGGFAASSELMKLSRICRVSRWCTHLPIGAVNRNRRAVEVITGYA
jgi:hypothetical protein